MWLKDRSHHKYGGCMMLLKKYAVLLFACAAVSTLCAADTEVNMLRFDRIEPVMIHGKLTGIRGCMMNDLARTRWIGKHRKYIPGEECFKLDVKDGVATISFPDPLPAPYVENPGEMIHFYVGFNVLPPAESYRATGRVRFNKGKIRLLNGGDLAPSDEWQNFDFTCPGFFILITPEAGAEISFADLKLVPVYPEIGGEIALPNGGKLTKLLLPENADIVTRWGVAMWRGWLWKLTGVALPIETVKSVEPTTGAFAAVVDPELSRGWDLKVNSSGITLKCSESDDLGPALFDYMRVALGYAHYAPDCVKMPTLPVAELPAVERSVYPRYNAMLHSLPHSIMSGGKLRELRYMENDVDYYHMYNGNWIHFLNITMPREDYFGTHPEYFMMDAEGKRVASHEPVFIHQCFSNEDARKVMLEGLTDFVKAHPFLSRICLEPGDNSLFCLCPKCIAFNGTKQTNSELLMDFSNAAAAELKKIDPKIKFFRGAYLNRCYPPKKVKPADNIHVFLCLTEHVLPCLLHADCERNRVGIKMVEEWNQALGGDASRLGFQTYDDARPLGMVRMAEYLNRFGSGDFYMYQWHYTPAAVNFVMPRWNLGEDADKLMEEFDLYYYGKAGGAMHEITLFIDDYARNYEHKDKEGKCVVVFCGHQLHTRSALDRAAFDQLYKLFDKAIAAAGDDKVVRARIFEEKKCVLAEDFIKYGPSSCGTEAELDAFVKRLVDFITMAREAPQKFERVSADQNTRSFLQANTGLNIPDTGKFWANEPFIDEFLADPKSYFASADSIPGGWYFKPLAMRGAEAPALYGYECPPRYCVALRRPVGGGAPVDAYAPAGAKTEVDRSKVTITMNLKYAPAAPSYFFIEGQDDDKPGVSKMSVTVNGKSVFAGLNRFPEKLWGRMVITIPAGVLVKGKNTIVIANITPDKPARSARFSDPEEAAKDPQWGWIALSEAYWLDPNSEFAHYLKGDFTTPWGFTDGNQRSNPGVGISGGKAIITEGERGPAYYCGHMYPKLAIEPGGRVRITVRASGSGNLRMGLWNYLAHNGKIGAPQYKQSGYSSDGCNLLPRSVSPVFKLTAAPNTFSCVLIPAKHTGLVVPRVFTDKGARAEITDVRIELLPPQGKR